MTNVSRETLLQIRRFKALVIAENTVQNLVSPRSILEFEARHVEDAIQLVALGKPGTWCDIGSGAGLPGIVIGLVTNAPMTLIEPRKLRAKFLREAIAELHIDATVVATKAERVIGQFDNITARAVADVSKLFEITEHLAHRGTRWILPKGKSAQKELESARLPWQGSFMLVPSRTSEEAMILIAEDVRRRGKR